MREKFHIPSFRATLHFLVVLIITQVAWEFFSKQLENKIIREVGFLVLFIVVLIIVAWYLPKLSPVLSGSSKAKKPDAPQQALILQAESPLLTWMNAELIREKNMPRNFIQVRVDWFGLYLDSIAGPYLIFRFAVRTSTMHALVFLPDKMSGNIKYLKHDLPRTPKLEDKGHDVLTRETQVILPVKQFLEPGAADHFRKLHSNKDVPEASFEFSDLRIYMKAYKADKTVDSDLCILPLPGAWKVKISDEIIRS